MFEPHRVHEVVDFIFSLLLKQADYDTLTPDASLLARAQCLGFSPPQIDKGFHSNANLVGREFASTRVQTAQDLRLARTFELSGALAGWAAAHGLGKVTTAGTGPYTHTIIFQDPAVSKLVPVQTVYEEMWGQATVKRRYESLAVESFSISGRAREICQLSVNFVGKGKVTTGALGVAVPAVTAVTLFDMGSAIFKWGAQAAAADITTRLVEFSATFSHGLDVASAAYPGSGIYNGRMWLGRRMTSFSVTVFVDSANTDIYDTWIADTVRECSIKLVNGAHSIELLWPAVKPRVTVVEVDGKLAYRIEASTPEEILLGAGGTPDKVCQIIVINEIASYLG